MNLKNIVQAVSNVVTFIDEQVDEVQNQFNAIKKLIDEVGDLFKSEAAPSESEVNVPAEGQAQLGSSNPRSGP